MRFLRNAFYEPLLVFVYKKEGDPTMIQMGFMCNITNIFLPYCLVMYREGFTRRAAAPKMGPTADSSITVRE